MFYKRVPSTLKRADGRKECLKRGEKGHAGRETDAGANYLTPRVPVQSLTEVSLEIDNN